MIIVRNNGYLEYKNFKFRCALGKAGVKTKIQEGDNITPKGTYKILNIYYRKDRIKKIKSSINKIKINKNMGWCDDALSKYYNKQIKLPSKFSHEILYRKDNIYDIVCVINYNINQDFILTAIVTGGARYFSAPSASRSKRIRWI